MAPVLRRLILLLAVCGLAAPTAAGCGGSPSHQRGAAAARTASANASTPAASADGTARLEAALARALPPDSAIGYPPDRKYDASTGATGLTEKTIFHCETVKAASSDILRVTRVSREWLSPGWTSGKQPQVSVRIELTVYQDGGAAQAVRELRDVPSTCHSATDSTGASRTHAEQKYTVRGVRNSAGVIARLRYFNGATGFEATAGLQHGEHLVGYLVVTTTSWTMLGGEVARLLPRLKAALDRAGPIADGIRPA
jgi:hypothetical protein